MRIMSLFSKLLFVGSICAGASFAQAQNYELRRQIHFLANKIVDVVNYENLTTEELRDVRDRLQETLNSIGMEQKPSLLCMKNNYGLYYPVNAETGKVIGSDEYSSGYKTLEACRETLPSPRDMLACFKQGYGLFYPTNYHTGKVVGSSEYSSGYKIFQDCKMTLPKANDRVACFKQNYGLFYPTNPKTGMIIGSDDYSAGYKTFEACRRVIEQ